MSSPASLEQAYYEFDGFWNPTVTPLGESDRQRVRAILQMVPADVRSLLDVGCGNGIFCNFASVERSEYQIIGIDRSSSALKYVRTPRALGNVNALPWPDATFDCVTALEILEHLPIRTFLQARSEIARLARKFIVVSVPNSQTLGKGMTECPACKSRFDPDLHVRSFNRATMRDLFADQGFACTDIQELGWSENRPGLSLMVRVMRRRQRGHMHAPLCPICGFENRDFLNAPSEHPAPPVQRHPLVATARQGVKRAWPVTRTSRWIAALYVRTSES